MKRILLLALFASLFLSAAPAMADMFGDGGVALDGVLDSITASPTPGNTSVNVLTDEIPEGLDKHWHTTASGASVNTMVMEMAGFAANNIFGVYDIANPANKVEIFSGANVAGNQTMLSVSAAGGIYINGAFQSDFGSSWFGYYLDSSYYSAS